MGERCGEENSETEERGGPRAGWYKTVTSPTIFQLTDKSADRHLQQILEIGEVPEGWKKANVTPIFKKGTKGCPGNYRSV
jgi:hypothetical protein